MRELPVFIIIQIHLVLYHKNFYIIKNIINQNFVNLLTVHH